MVKPVIAGLFAALGAAAVSAPAQAALLINYSDFTGACGTSLSCVGNTAEAGTALRVTPATGSQAGAGYSTTPVSLGASATFSTVFQFQLTSPGGIAPADGITFVVSAGSSGLGAGGGGIGYQGVGNSIAIEFDTFDNGETGGSNHVGLDINGSLASSPVASPYGVSTCDFGGNSYLGAGCMSNGNVWTATIGYDGNTDRLTVSVKDGAAGTHLLIDTIVDIASILGTNTAFVGFTSGTGSGFENHDILNWQLDNTTVLAPVGAPEPASLTLLGLGMAGLGLLRRRKNG